MNKKVYVALITPFLEDDSIDYHGIATLLDTLIHDGIDGFIICGTTAESCTLSEDEKFAILSFVISHTKHQKEIYFGCGNNNTLDTLRLCRKAQNYAIDGVLLVTPYYNKPSQNGLYEHYRCICSNIELPVILYQVESRCNCILECDTLERIAKNCSNVIALKYASKNMEYAKIIRKKLPCLQLYCGDDTCIKECKDVGMDGIISVIGHICAKELIAFYKKEDWLFDYYFKRIASLLFVETNPVGIKYVLSLHYPIAPKVRLPLVELEAENKQLLNAYFDKK